MFPKTFLAAFMIAGCSAPVLAQGLADNNAARVAREARRDAREAREVRPRAALPENQPKTDLTVGLAYDSGEDDSRVTSTPFALSHKTAGSDNDWWKFQLLGDGYTRITAPGEPQASGLGDLTFNVFRPLAPKLIGMVGVGIPTHGEVGSDYWSERARLIYSADISKVWSYVLIGKLAHQHHSAPGLASTSQGLYGEVDYSFGDDQVLAFSISRGHRRGVRGTTELGLEYDFALVPGKWDMSLIVGRGVTREARHTAVEVDITIRF